MHDAPVVLITGAPPGIGRAFAFAFVFACDKARESGKARYMTGKLLRVNGSTTA